ncbi:MAG: aldehyde dehydrogenase family protein [Nitrososphaeraceae archaeon]
MKFVNEQTYQKFIDKKRENEFHEKFEIEILSLKNKLNDKNIYPIIIDNKKIFTKRNFKHISPIDKRITLGYISIASENEVKKAVESSHRAFEKWGILDYNRRIAILKKAVKELRKRKFELSALVTFENGKNRYEATADIDEAIDFINYYCVEMKINNGFVSKNYVIKKNEKNISFMKPYGVWGIISPFNFPAAIFVGMIVGAIITGNTAVVKPASDTPVIGYKIVEILINAGIPIGVLNFITGSGKYLGDFIVRNKKIAGIVFTGSKEIGCQLVRESSRVTLRPIIAELGGKNPTIVTQDADLDKAVNGITKAAFSYSGQKCSACSRVYVHKKVKNDFINKLLKNVENFTVSNPVEKRSDMGPVINSDAYQKYKKYTKIASKHGKLLYGGSTIEEGDLKYGYYVKPTIIEDIYNKSPLVKNELFLPMLIINEYDNYENALRLANSSEYGLTAGIYSNNSREIELFLQNIESGVLYVNREKGATTGAMVGQQSFGGWKKSGTSGKGAGGKYYLSQFMREQSQTLVS